MRRTALAAAAALFTACSAVSAIDTDPYLAAIEIEDVDLSNVPDGVYGGEYTIVTPPGTYAMNRHFEVEVEIAGGRMTRVVILKPEGMRADERFTRMCRDVVESGGMNDVDAVSGASYSSRAFLKAVENAVLRAAGRAT